MDLRGGSVNSSLHQVCILLRFQTHSRRHYENPSNKGRSISRRPNTNYFQHRLLHFSEIRLYYKVYYSMALLYFRWLRCNVRFIVARTRRQSRSLAYVCSLLSSSIHAYNIEESGTNQYFRATKNIQT